MRGVSIFLVEDETLIRMMVVEMLKELGHRVVAEAGSIQTAEPLARTSEFDLAVFDINVAGFIISPIAEIVATRGLPFVFISGYGPEGLPALFKDKPVLRKPFLISQFAAMIHSALSDGPSPARADERAADVIPRRAPWRSCLTRVHERRSTTARDESGLPRECGHLYACLGERCA